MTTRELTRQAKATRALDAGVSLLREAGSVDDLSVRQVCALSQSSASSFYRLFGSRDLFIVELHRTLLTQAAAAGADLLDRVGASAMNLDELIPYAVAQAQCFADENLWFVSRFAPRIRSDRQHAALFDAARAGILSKAFTLLADRLGSTAGVPKQRMEVAIWMIGATMIRASAGRAPIGSDPKHRERQGVLLSQSLLGYLTTERAGLPDLVTIPTLEIDARTAGSTKDRILDAAELLIATRDVADLTTLDIAIEAGVAPATVHDVFGSRTELIRCLLARALDDVYRVAEEALEQARIQQLDEPEDLMVFVANAFAVLAAFWSERLHILGAFELPQRVSPELARMLSDLQDTLVEQAIQRAPGWISKRGNLEAGAFVAIIAKEVLQLAFWGPSPYGARLGWDLPGLIRELTLAVTAAIESPILLPIDDGPVCTS